MKRPIVLIIILIVIAGGIFVLTGKKGEQNDNAQPSTSGGQNKKVASSIEDVCSYFPKELIESAINKPVLKVEESTLTGTKNCLYYTIYTDDYEYSPYSGRSPGGAPVVVTYSTDTAELEKDKISNEKTGSKYEKDESIGMDNYVVRDFGGTIWQVILFLGQDKYIRMHYVHSAVTGPELLKIGIKFAEKIQNN
ncbi:MAG: hypothetical protein WC306_00585 [Candidatus Paceibacterota bacterium]|jgi:hypothetical protein